MTEHTSNPLAAASFASIVADALDARARELTLTWLDRVRQRGTARRFAGTQVAETTLSGHVPELVRAFAAALADPPAPGAEARVGRELTLLVRLRRAQGHRVTDVLSDLGLLQDVLLGAVLAAASSPGVAVPAPAVLELVSRFNHAAREMVEVTLRLFEQDLLARRQMRASLLTTFARTVTHELRNRVNAARLSLSAFRVAPEERQGEMLDNLDSSLELLEGAAADVFSVALQARELPAEGRLQPLGELLEHLRHDFDELALSSRIEIRVKEPIPDLAVDAVKVQLALLNLVTNAIKHSDRSRAERWVEIGVIPGGERDEWRVDVEDNGAGLPTMAGAPGFEAGEESRDERRAAAISRHEVGIALAHEAVRLLGGRLWVQANSPGQGTTLSFTMRAAVMDRDVRASTAS